MDIKIGTKITKLTIGTTELQVFTVVRTTKTQIVIDTYPETKLFKNSLTKVGMDKVYLKYTYIKYVVSTKEHLDRFDIQNKEKELNNWFNRELSLNQKESIYNNLLNND